MRAWQEHPDTSHGTPPDSVQVQPLHVRTAAPAFHFNEELYRILYDNNPSMYFTLDLHGIVLSVNRFGAEQLGYLVEELLGKPVLTVFHDEDKPAVRRQLTLLLEQPGHVRRWQLRKIKKDGTVMWVEEDARAVRREDGSLMILVVCSDISYRKRAEEALQDSEERYRLLVNQATDIIYRIDATGHFTFINPTAMRLTGYAESELLGHRFTEFIRPDYRAASARLYWRQLIRKTPTTYFEFPALAKDGREIWFGQNVQLLQEEGRVTGFSAVARDITERKRAEERLKTTTRQLETLIQASPLAIMSLDTEGNHLVRWNRAAEQIFGWREEEVLGRPLPNVLPELEGESDALWNQAVREGFLRGVELQHLRKDGTLIDIALWVTVLKAADGRVTDTFGIVEDITDRKRVEKALQRSQGELQRALREREQLARNLHDNIIQSIYAVGFTLEECQALLKGAPANANRKLGQVIAELNRVIREVRGYLVTPAEESETLSTDELIASLQRLGGFMENADGMRFSLALDPSAAGALTAGQRAQFLYVAQEAMSNSLRHSGARTAQVSLACTSNRIRLEISDNGAGFALPGMRNGNGGLKNIRVRARRIGASLDIASHPMGGTVISMEIPTGA